MTDDGALPPAGHFQLASQYCLRSKLFWELIVCGSWCTVRGHNGKLFIIFKPRAPEPFTSYRGRSCNCVTAFRAVLNTLYNGQPTGEAVSFTVWYRWCKIWKSNQTVWSPKAARQGMTRGRPREDCEKQITSKERTHKMIQKLQSGWALSVTHKSTDRLFTVKTDLKEISGAHEGRDI